MKKNFILIALTLLLISNVFAEKNIISVFKDSKNTIDLKKYLEDGLKELNIDITKEIPKENISIINYILKFVYENNIHKMRNEDDNVVYTKKTGEEAVFNKNGDLVNNDWNKGSFNYGKYEQPINKFLLDIWPWLVWGNTKNDPTTFDERFYYYCMDLNPGIQKYIFLEDKSLLEKIEYSKLKEEEKLVYHFFNYLFFNEKFKYKLDERNIKNYKKSAENYWKYLSQIMELSGYKQND
jgi:hypothetical protein